MQNLIVLVDYMNVTLNERKQQNQNESEGEWKHSPLLGRK